MLEVEHQCNDIPMALKRKLIQDLINTGTLLDLTFFLEKPMKLKVVLLGKEGDPGIYHKTAKRKSR